MNISVIYVSRGGHTKKLAEAIAEAVGVQALDVKQPHTPEEADLLFVGTGIYGGKPDGALLDYLDNLPAGKIGGAAIFCNSATGSNNTETIASILRNKNIQVLPMVFTCKGQFLFMNRKHPDEEDCAKARAFAQKVLSLVNQ